LSLKKKSLRKKKKPLVFATTCGAGLEDLTSIEIKECGGFEIQISPGAVSWQGDLEAGYKLCLWSRFSSRVLLQLLEFEAPNTDALYNHASTIDWDAHFTPDTDFAVFCTLSNSPITHSQFAALRIKDAIVDQFRTRTNKRPNINTRKPSIRINLHVQGTTASLSLDLSGESLHRRGYRVSSGEAPLKETLAAGIVRMSGWDMTASPDFSLVDPMCGSGTLLIEAAMMYGDIAPGLQRKSFGFMSWLRHSPNMWERLVNDALEREELGMEKDWPQIIGYDADPIVINAARKNIDQAGLDEKIIVRQGQLASLKSPCKNGLMVVNPPYGERLEEKETVKYLYRCLGRIFKDEFPAWSLGFFTANSDFADMLQANWSKRISLFNGSIKCRLLVGISKELQLHNDFPWTIQPLEDSNSENDFSNRLRKNCSALFKWAEQEKISCFRIYDADIPEFNLTIDLYENYVHVQEYAAPDSIDPTKAKQRFELSLQVIRNLLNVPHSQIFIKTRQKQKGNAQYQKRTDTGKLFEVHEHNCGFLVNFTDYLDTGLFLDHRITRSLLAQHAKNVKFLNLFGYTGAASVHAAFGGATSTTTVDISENYLQRARANLALNGFGGPLHNTVCDDCLQWLERSKEHFGLIFVDPPTFSNARHRKQVFDIQKDHERLLTLAMDRLNNDGLLFFSTNFRKFKLSQALIDTFLVDEITSQTIPRDFKNNPKIHQCWQFRHRV
jgi:23S rRNA (guanine2445-N2)-methyltransferase / 23S rRNA (guanine2069-N7)-methyltransferase